VLGAVLIALPWLVAAAFPGQQRYILHVLIFTALYGALALSFDLVVGHVGSLSLAHPAFFGVGAYGLALLATEARWPFTAALAAGLVLAGLGRRGGGGADVPPHRAQLRDGHARARAGDPDRGDQLGRLHARARSA
jgi:branched-chain amino acid transport system permease protein